MRSTGRKARALQLLFAAVVLSSGPLRAQERESPVWLTFEEILRRDMRPGEAVDVVGRYVELRDDEIVLFQSPVTFVTDSQSLRRRVLTLAHEHENLRFRTVYLGSEDGTPRFEVKEVVPDESDERVFLEEIRKLHMLGSDGVNALLGLARRIYLTEKRFGKPSLRRYAHAAATAAIKIREKELAPDDVHTRLEDVGRIHDALPDREFIMRLLAALETRYPRSDEIREALIKLNCRRFRGEWMTYESFKRLQGYVKRGERWVKPYERAFLDVVGKFLDRKDDPIPRRMMNREYMILAKKGDVAVGMTREEVQHALGFPDRVFRRRVRKFGKSRELDQWVYGDRYYYFLDGELIGHPDEKFEDSF